MMESGDFELLLNVVIEGDCWRGCCACVDEDDEDDEGDEDDVGGCCGNGSLREHPDRQARSRISAIRVLPKQEE